jgi:4-amino-4-deoxy-L-arabinose transferase-like glycosyltransferase
MTYQKYFNPLIILISSFYLVFAIWGLHFYPIDETRYMSVAWEMWLRQDYVVPHLNGLPYSHKPPLLFWLINLGWHFFGVNDWWPRFIPFLFSIGTIFITKKIAEKLWQKNKNIGSIAALFLLANTVWAIFSSVLMFDMILTFFTSLGILGLVTSLKEKNKKGFLYLTIAFAGGLLTKGPTIFLQVLPLAIMAPWWLKQKNINWKSWYSFFAIAFIVGIGILLCWAIPAGISGGSQYQHDIFWGQTANRMVNSFAHKRSQWWYLEIAPILLFPWLLIPSIWKSIIQRIRQPISEGLKFSLIWFFPVFVIFSLISGKQVQYLLPTYPALALIIASYFDEIKKTLLSDDLVLMAILLFTSVFYFLITFHFINTEVPWINYLDWRIGPLLLIFLLIFIVWRTKDKFIYLAKLVIINIIVMFTIFVGLIDQTGDAYDLRRISGTLKKLEEQGATIAYLGKYAGQFSYAGKLQGFIQSINKSELFNWAAEHPRGYIIIVIDKKNDIKKIKSLYADIYRGGYIAIVSSEQINQVCKSHLHTCDEH